LCKAGRCIFPVPSAMELTAFVPLAAAGPSQVVGRAASLRGSAAPEAPLAGESWGPGLLAPLGVACTCLGLSAQRRAPRGSAAQRRFSGRSSTFAVPKSYRDFTDPWLQNADLGFDPLNLAVSGGTFDSAASAVPETTYYNYRESEVKHGRFAMAAFLAIFFEEADRGAVLRQMGVLDAADNLDGTLGLDEVQGPVLAIGIGLQALAEYNLQNQEDDGNFLSVEYDRDRCPGDLGFDPLNLLRSDGNKAYLHNVEVNIGRLAMIGVTSFLVKEYALKDL